MFDLDRIRASGLLRQLEFREEIDSTNNLAIALLAESALETPALVLAERQTAGRGRGTNRWWADGGALTFSLVISPDAAGISSERWPRISHCAALAVAEAIEEFVPTAEGQLKWPNDVYLAGRKVCGVLVEVPAASKGEPQRVVVGIGVNVNNSLAGAPEDVRARAISLADVCGTSTDMTAFLLTLVQRFHEALAHLAANDAVLFAGWSRRCLLSGRTVAIDIGGRQIRGRCRGVAEDGALLVESTGGLERVLGGIVLEFA
ncbi:MAG: biotin--[acetyl-CoA-carboxylase] ligase [Pirellulales bacterium]|nr:biotin--[acetyl-CoA-carboxylase] ligase [Pirellulales bacterium]